MDGHSAGKLAGLWSRLAHAHLAHLRAPIDGHGFVSYLHDVGLSALAAAIIMLGVVILLELRSMARLRHVTDRSLARVFEQLDLLRFETQALLEERRESRQAGVARHAAIEYVAPSLPQPAPVAAQPRSAVPPATAAVPAERAVPVERRNLSSGEARLLSSLAEARARRVATAEAVRA